jgi:vacuolar-type H+-ATPase subunit E/Vma4
MNEQIQELGLELAQITKKEIEKIKENTLNMIKLINDETDRKIKKDVYKLENTIVQNTKLSINKKISEKINLVNRNILIKKNNLYEQLIKTVVETLTERIESNMDGYMEFLAKKTKELSPLLNTKVYMYLNERDLLYVRKHPKALELDSENIQISSTPIETSSGFKIEALDHSFLLDLTYESHLERLKDDISKIYMKKFPVFDINLEGTRELLDQFTKKAEGELINGNH